MRFCLSSGASRSADRSKQTERGAREFASGSAYKQSKQTEMIQSLYQNIWKYDDSNLRTHQCGRIMIYTRHFRPHVQADKPAESANRWKLLSPASAFFVSGLLTQTSWSVGWSVAEKMRNDLRVTLKTRSKSNNKHRHTTTWLLASPLDFHNSSKARIRLEIDFLPANSNLWGLRQIF